MSELADEDWDHLGKIWAKQHSLGVHYGNCELLSIGGRDCDCAANFETGWLVGLTMRMAEAKEGTHA